MFFFFLVRLEPFFIRQELQGKVDEGGVHLLSRSRKLGEHKESYAESENASVDTFLHNYSVIYNT